MRRLALLVVSAMVLAGAGCSRDQVRAGEAVVSIDKGSRVLIGERGDDLRPAQGRHTLHVGAQVKVLAGSASIALGEGGQLDVRTGSEVELGSPVSLVNQDLLVTSGTQPVKVAVAGSQVTVNGVARLTRDLAVSAATYRGSVTLQSAARSLTVPALRQAEVPSLGVLPAEPEALTYDVSDSWDRNFLGVAMDLNDQLDSRSKGFTNSLGAGEGYSPGFFRLLLPVLENEPTFTQDLIADILFPGDTLVGASIAISGRTGSFSDRWDAVFGFKSKGATWGLVALDQQVNDTDALVRSIDTAIGAQSFAFAPPRAVAPAGTSPAPAPVVAPPPPPAPSPGTTAAPAPAKPPATTTPASGPPSLVTLPDISQLIPPPESGEPGLLTPLLEVVTQTLDGLLSSR